MQYRAMSEADIAAIAPHYMHYYNTHDGDAWTFETTCKRIHQVWSREDSLCLVLEDDGAILGFCMGYLNTYFDLTSYDLVEILIFDGHQSRGLGTAFMQELECRAKAAGAAMIQLQSVNDAMHSHFYGKLGYGDCTNLVLKSKFL